MRRPPICRFALALFLTAVAHPALTGQAQTTAVRNVVVILVDDLGWADLSCQGSNFYRTPHIDRLAGDGMRFTQGYAAAAICSPTRAAIQTGREPARTGVTDWIRARFQRGGTGTPATNPTDYIGGPNRALLCPPNPYWLEHAELTLGELLQSAGLRTAHIGKWHLGDPAWYPEQQGYDENHGGCDYGQPPSYFDPYRTDRLPKGIPGLAPRTPGEYLTDREGDIAANYIARHRDRPFFLHYAPYAVHTPIQAPDDLTAVYAERRRPRARQANPRYAAMVDRVDAAVGKILATLDRHGLRDDTLVVFTSDNGGLRGVTHNHPLRSGKGYPYEGGLRVPWIVRWPGVTTPGSISDTPVTSVDLLPTVLDAVGTPAPDRPLDGVSLRPVLAGGQLPARPLFWHFPHYRGDVLPYSVIRDGEWKLIVRHQGPSYELFDLAEDPGERHDVATREPERVAALRTQLERHLDDVGARLPRTNPAHQPRPRVLILGDSISIGYTPGLREALKDVAVVVRPTGIDNRPENCAGTTNGVLHLDRWLALGGGHWDVIHFNFGLHDLKRVHADTGSNSNDPEDPRQAEPETYARQLREICRRLRSGAPDARLILATTTPVPPGELRPHRDPADAVRYNDIARRVAAEFGIQVNDLFGLVEPRQAELLPRPDVHFLPAGNQLLAGHVAAVLRAALATR